MTPTHTTIRSAVSVTKLTPLIIYALIAHDRLPSLKTEGQQALVDIDALNQWCDDNLFLHVTLRCISGREKHRALREYLKQA